ncbi:hypothetical protein HGO21_34640 [Acinetobacter sp. CUI P1]|nr:hypothetical protein [Acinetobacter sp. CUI P1]
MLNITVLNWAAICEIIELQWERFFLSDPLLALLQAEEMTKLIVQVHQGYILKHKKSAPCADSSCIFLPIGYRIPLLRDEPLE